MIVYVVPFSIIGFIVGCILICQIAPVFLVPIALLFPIGMAIGMTVLTIMAMGSERQAKKWYYIGIAVIAALVIFIFANLENWLSNLSYTMTTDFAQNGSYYAYIIGMVIGATIYVVAMLLETAGYNSHVHHILAIFVVIAVIIGIGKFLQYGPDYFIRTGKYAKTTPVSSSIYTEVQDNGEHFTLQVLNDTDANTEDAEIIYKVYVYKVEPVGIIDSIKGKEPKVLSTLNIAQQLITPNMLYKHIMRPGMYSFIIVLKDRQQATDKYGTYAFNLEDEGKINYVKCTVNDVVRLTYKNGKVTMSRGAELLNDKKDIEVEDIQYATLKITNNGDRDHKYLNIEDVYARNAMKLKAYLAGYSIYDIFDTPSPMVQFYLTPSDKEKLMPCQTIKPNSSVVFHIKPDTYAICVKLENRGGCIYAKEKDGSPLYKYLKRGSETEYIFENGCLSINDNEQ